MSLLYKLQFAGLELQFPEELNYLKSLPQDKLHPVIYTFNWTEY